MINPADIINFTTISVALMIIGAIGVAGLKKPLDKIIMFDVLETGFVIALISTKYLDVAFIAAIFEVISTVILLIAVTKIYDIRNRKEAEE